MSEPKLSSNWAKLSAKSSVPKAKVVRKKTKTVTSSRVESSVAEKKKKLTTLEIFQRAAVETQTQQKQQQDEEDTAAAAFSLDPPEGQLVGKKAEPGKFLAIDCEFVGVGPEGVESALARVSVVNFYGHVILDKYVKPKEKVTDWRTWVSGILPKHMKEAITFREAQQLCSDLFKDRILVGHAIQHDMSSLMLSHPAYMIRDTSKHLPFRQLSNGKTPGLKKLTQHYLKTEIQSGEHSSVEDARATMMLYRMHKKEFEMAQRQKYGTNQMKGRRTVKR